MIRRRGFGAATGTIVAPPAALPAKGDEAASTSSPPEHMHAKTFSLRSQVLLALVVQNASIPLLTRLSRSPSSPSTEIYNPAIAILMTEVVKAVVSLACHGVERRQRRRVREKVDRGWQAWVRESGKMIVPAGLYSVQNRLLYTALTHLDAPTFQATYQLKLLTSALFSTLFFKRTLSPLQITSLLLLTAGVALVQLDQLSSLDMDRTNEEGRMIGLGAILAACGSSGLAGGWFEYLLKSPALALKRRSSTKENNHARVSIPSLWERNLQLSLPSLLFALLGVYLSSPSTSHISLEGFTPLVYFVILNQALGGLLVGLVVRYADGVVKGFAGGLAIVLSTVFSIVFLGLVPGRLFLAGASMVVGATGIWACA